MMKTKNDIMGNKKDRRNVNTLRSSIKKLLQITVFSAVVMTSTNAFACEGANLQRANTLADITIHLMDNLNTRGVSLYLIQTTLTLDQVYRQFPASCQQAYDVWARKQFPPAPQVNSFLNYSPNPSYALQSRVENNAMMRYIDKLPW